MMLRSAQIIISSYIVMIFHSIQSQKGRKVRPARFAIGFLSRFPNFQVNLGMKRGLGWESVGETMNI